LKFKDDLNRIVNLKNPKRIISLVPSITELLYDLGLGERIIAVTRFCKYPKKEIEKTDKIGGTKDFDLQKIRSLKPDLIIAVKEENDKNRVLEIAKEFPLYVFDITNISTALEAILKIGEITETEKQAKELHQKIKIEIQSFSFIKEKKVCYLIWEKPMMTIGNKTFISEMLHLAGYKNSFSDKKENYFSVTVEDIKTEKPELIFLSSEPFPFKEKHKKQFQEQFIDSKIILVDGEMFTWYGSRMLKAINYFKQLNKEINKK
jgi:ABC-type Fe3+-hydroxamate transport system substrate-binding protein